MDQCCKDAGDAVFLQDFGMEDFTASQGFTNYLNTVASRWGELAKAWISELVLRTSYRSDFVNADIKNIRCQNGHIRPLVVVGARLYFFIWRANFLVADYWTLTDKLYEGLIPKPNADLWPNENLINELEEAVSIYFGKGDLSSANFTKFNQLVSTIHPIPSLVYTWIVDMAELFILFHEVQHVFPSPPNLRVNLQLSGESNISSTRQAKWLEEEKADVNSAYFLLISATDYLQKTFGLSLADAKKVAAGTVFSGADAALHTLAMLEKIRYGEISIEDAATRSEYRTHPPSFQRRNTLSQACKILCLNIAGEEMWNIVRDSVAAEMIARDKLFNTFFASRKDFITKIRNGGIV